MSAAAPALHMAPRTRRMVNQVRLHVGILGLVLFRAVGGFVHSEPWSVTIQICNAAAWVTVLTVDPTRLPEFTTTKNRQLRSWRATLMFLPVLAALLVVGVWVFKVIPLPDLASYRSPGLWAGMLFTSYLDTLLFCNIIQPQLRRFGLAVPFTITLQAASFGAVWLLAGASLVAAGTAIIVAVFNGWLVYRYRSLWAAWIVSVLWHLFCH
jgi:hypothetical protein